MRYRIALVDDHPRILNQLTSELNFFSELQIVLTARNGEDYLRQLKVLPEAQHPHVVIMDIEMPVMGGIEAVRTSSLLYTSIQYIMFTVNDDDDKLFEAITAGAGGYLLKEERADILVSAIKEVIEKSGAPMSPSIARKTLKLLSRKPEKVIPASPTESSLSEREIDILKGIVSGMNYKQIADKLFLSPFTVRNHISNIYNKLHISSKAQAVKLALQNNWV